MADNAIKYPAATSLSFRHPSYPNPFEDQELMIPAQEDPNHADVSIKIKRPE